MFILVPVCWVVADVLASAIQFDVITHDVFIVAALPSEIGVAFPAAEHCDCGFVGSNAAFSKNNCRLCVQIVTKYAPA